MATRVNGTAESWVGMKVTPYFYYALTETNTEYKLALYGGVNFNKGYGDELEVSLQITGTGKTTIYKCLGLEPVAGDKQFINSFTWSWTKTHSTQSITIKAIHGTWTDYDNPKPIGRPAYAASKTFSISAKPSYAISYNANGGSGAPTGQTKWYGEDINLQAGKPTRTGYVFKCWNTKQNGTGTNYNPSQKYTGNSGLTLYAIWNPVIYYNANGGSGAPSSQTKTFNQNLTLSPTKPNKTGYGFKNWNTKADGSGTSYNSGGTYTSNDSVTLYAQWEPLNKITVYDQNGVAHTGKVYIYDDNGNRHQCIISVYDENGNRKYPKG